ncbi:MAG: hypothetical protein ACLQVI_22100 [Polyangiaceae bacterium]
MSASSSSGPRTPFVGSLSRHRRPVAGFAFVASSKSLEHVPQMFFAVFALKSPARTFASSAATTRSTSPRVTLAITSGPSTGSTWCSRCDSLSPTLATRAVRALIHRFAYCSTVSLGPAVAGTSGTNTRVLVSSRCLGRAPRRT